MYDKECIYCIVGVFWCPCTFGRDMKHLSATALLGAIADVSHCPMYIFYHSLPTDVYIIIFC